MKNFSLILVLSLLAFATSLFAQPLVADWDYWVVDDGSANQGVVEFYNLSSGSYQYASWEFGDNTVETTMEDTIRHSYAWLNYHTVCLTIWNDNGDFDKKCRSIFVGPDSLKCVLTDCVYPGDVTHDGVVDYYDIVEITPFLGEHGPERYDASTDWIGQYARDWTKITPSGVNLKHLDCDGNGLIDDLDVDIILMRQNFEIPQQPHSGDLLGPTVYLEFEQDTFFIDHNSNGTTELRAKLHFGTALDPFDDLNAIALYINYDLKFLPTQKVNFFYNDKAFTGDIDEPVMHTHNDFKSKGQMDLAIARMDGNGQDGSGEVGEIVFIIEDDLIELLQSPEDPVELDFTVGGVRAVDYKGRPLDVNVEKFPRKVVFLRTVTGVNNPALDAKLDVSPNPFDTDLSIQAMDLNIQSVSMFNTLGQLVYQSGEINAGSWQMSEASLQPGVYMLHIATDEGVSVQKVVKR